MRSLPLVFALLVCAAFAAPIPSGLLGTRNSLAGSDFCRKYACRLVSFGQFGDSPGYGPTYAVNIPGVAVRLARYPDVPGVPTARDVQAAPALIAELTVDARLPWSRLSGRVGRVASDFFAFAAGVRELPGLYDNCVSKASFNANKVGGLEDLISLSDKASVKCIYRPDVPGKLTIAASLNFGE